MLFPRSGERKRALLARLTCNGRQAHCHNGHLAGCHKGILIGQAARAVVGSEATTALTSFRVVRCFRRRLCMRHELLYRQGMGGHRSPSLAAHRFQPAPSGREALAARSEAGGAVGSARAGSIRTRRRPRHQRPEAGGAKEGPRRGASGLRRAGSAPRFVFLGPERYANPLLGA